MEKLPKISIIIPVYNAAKYIGKCIESLLNQTHKNLEIICVDDCSTDNSLDIMKNYAQSDKRLIVLKAEKNSGPATARNIALQHITGDYLMFCDNDDTYQAEMCEKMLGALISHDVDFAICKNNICYESDYSHDQTVIDYTNNGPIGYIDFTETNKNIINVILWNKIFKTSIIKKYGICFPDGITHEDDAFIFQYMTIARTCYGLKDRLYNYLIHKDSYMATSFFHKAKRKIRFDCVRSLQFVYEFLKRNNLYETNKDYFAHCEYNELFALVQYQKKGDKEIAFKMISELVESDKLPKSSLDLFNSFFPKKNQTLKPLERIFSVKNIPNHKQIVICGLKFKIRRREKCEL